MFQTAIIGINGFGRVHYNDLKREVQKKRCQLRAAVIRHPKADDPALAELRAMGTEIFSDVGAMFQKFAGQLDLCCIPSGIDSHLALTTAALEAGCNVLVEKPVTPTYQDALTMAACAARSGKFVAVGYQDIYQPTTAKIKNFLLSGALGRVKTLKCYALWPRPLEYYTRNSWAGKIWGNSHQLVLDAPFTNALGHYLNLLNFYAGKTFEEPAQLHSLEAVMSCCNDIETCDTAAIKIKTCDDQTLLFWGTHAAGRNVDPITEIIGEQGRIAYTRNHARITGSTGEVLDEFDLPVYPQMREAIYDAVFERIVNPKRFICSVPLAAATVLIGNAVFDAAPIVRVPEDYFTSTRLDGKPIRVMNQIDRVIEQCFASERLPDQRDYPFLRQPQKFDFAGYRGFDGRLFK